MFSIQFLEVGNNFVNYKLDGLKKVMLPSKVLALCHILYKNGLL